MKVTGDGKNKENISQQSKGERLRLQRKGIFISTYNVRSVGKTGQLQELATELGLYNISLCGIQEDRIKPESDQSYNLLKVSSGNHPSRNHLVILGVPETNSIGATIGGVGLFIHNNLDISLCIFMEIPHAQLLSFTLQLCRCQ